MEGVKKFLRNPFENQLNPQTFLVSKYFKFRPQTFCIQINSQFFFDTLPDRP